MQFSRQKLCSTWWLLLTACLVAAPLHAHLMVAQHGTLNIVGDRAFMVLSLPVSAFEGVDINSDGQVSMAEFDQSQALISQVVKQKVRLSEQNNQLPLMGLMVSAEAPHHGDEQVISQMIVMAQFPLENADLSQLDFQMGLFGLSQPEQIMKMTATRASDRQKLTFELSAQAPKKALKFTQ